MVVLVNIVQVDVPELVEDIVTVGGLNDVPGPEGETVSVSVTVPANPLRLVTVIVEELEEPAITVRVF